MTHVLLPGFGFRASLWEEVMAGTAHECLALEVPIRPNWSETVAALAQMGGAGTYVGYSMGGRLALGVALEYPGLVERLVLISTSPGIADPTDREARRRADERWNEILVDQGFEAFLDGWLDQPMFRDLGPAVRRHRIDDPATISRQLRVLGQGVMPSYWSRLAELETPVTIVAGAHDEKYVNLARAMGEAIGENAYVRVFAEAGHSLVLERPQRVAELL